jgi:hypothetical protein
MGSADDVVSAPAAGAVADPVGSVVADSVGRVVVSPAGRVVAGPSTTNAATADKLRDELIECDKLRADFLKWKLLLIAVLGGTGLSGKVLDGTMEPGTRTFVLLLIPFVCVYADLLCLQNGLRVFSIRRFISGLSNAASEVEPSILYEQKLGDGINSVYSMEAFALYWSTLLVDVMVAMGGFLQQDARASTRHIDAFQVAAAAGVFVAVGVGVVFKKQMERLSELFPHKGSADPVEDKRIPLRLAFGTVVALAAIFFVPSLFRPGVHSPASTAATGGGPAADVSDGSTHPE